LIDHDRRHLAVLSGVAPARLEQATVGEPIMAGREIVDKPVGVGNRLWRIMFACNQKHSCSEQD
jgi:hypothetical protein